MNGERDREKHSQRYYSLSILTGEKLVTLLRGRCVGWRETGVGTGGPQTLRLGERAPYIEKKKKKKVTCKGRWALFIYVLLLLVFHSFLPPSFFLFLREIVAEDELEPGDGAGSVLFSHMTLFAESRCHLCTALFDGRSYYVGQAELNICALRKRKRRVLNICARHETLVLVFLVKPSCFVFLAR